MGNATWESTDRWFVWTKRGRNPKYVHETREGANAEAQRLAGLHPGKKFHVLHAVGKVSVEADPMIECAEDRSEIHGTDSIDERNTEDACLEAAP